MTEFCNDCKRIVSSANHQCQVRTIRDVLSGVRDGAAPAGDRSWASKAQSTCLACPNWGTRDGSTGCLLSPTKPCDIGYYRRKGRGCFDDPPRFAAKPAEPANQEPLPQIKFPEFNWHSRGGKLAVCTIVIGEYGQQIADYTLPRIRKYADRVGADLVIIDEDQYPGWIMANKFTIGSVVANYDRTYYVDADVWIRDKAPDVFETFADDTVWVHQDADYLTRNFLAGDARRLGRTDKLDCWNTGVVLQDRKHANIWNPPTTLTETSWTAEQSSVEYSIKDNKYNVGLWNPSQNCQAWTGKLFWDNYATANVLHLSGIKNPDRIPILERLVREEGRC